ncbi:MAG: hypothetical protein KGL39_18520 [Patescibacteria group bacterium]|nr:hypothetical protein [Patescibacteria group bacterium]
MEKKKKAQRVIPDPTIPDVTVEIDGERFRLCFDFGALAIAKAKLRAAKVDVNILHSIDFSAADVDTIPALFFAASQKFQPDLSWEHARELVTLRTVDAIGVGLFSAYRAAMAEPAKNPQRAAGKS